MSSATNPNPHILVFPYPAQGHMLALLDFTHQLFLHNFTAITVVITPKNLPLLSPFLSSHPSIVPLVLPFPSHPSIPAGVEHVKDLGNTGNIPIIAALAKLYDPLVQWFTSHPNPPAAIISDFFLGWTQRLAAELNIPRITFYSTSVSLFPVNSYLWSNVEKFKPLKEVEFETLPGAPVFMEEHLPSIFRLYRRSDPDGEFVRDGMIGNTLTWASVFNSFEALEGKYLDHLRKEKGRDRVFSVGPLSLTGMDSSARGNDGPNPKDQILTWLDGCPDGSVVYVCFGSQKLLSREQMGALASGLEKSGTRFVWVVKSGTVQQMEAGYGAVPHGFEERVAGKGLVVKGWAQQVLILRHKAVGGFLSHCGWNSVEEAIVGGVMILAWPMEADQFLNARLLVEDLGVAVRVCGGANSVPDSEALGRVICESMRVGGEVKLKARELREEALAAVVDGGTSGRDFQRLVKKLCQLQSK